MAGVDGKLEFTVNFTYESTADFGTPMYKCAFTKINKMTAGTAAVTQADLMFADSRSLATGANEELDLAGSLTNVFGATLTFAEITAIYIENTGATTDITVGNATTNTFQGPFGASAHTLVLKPGETFAITNASGWTVTAGTGDKLKITNSAGATGTYKIVLVGRSVAA